MKPISYYEDLFSRSVPWLLILMACVLALLFPLSQELTSFRTAVLLGLALSLLAVLKLLFVKPRPVMILEDGSFVIRGVKPGAWKLFQRWFIERIDDKCVVSIRMGYLRGKGRSILFRLPPGEPSRNAIFQLFLWVTYTERGEEKEIYYPHLKNIKDYRDLAERLRIRFGPKCQENWAFTT